MLSDNDVKVFDPICVKGAYISTHEPDTTQFFWK